MENAGESGFSDNIENSNKIKINELRQLISGKCFDFFK